VGPQSVIEFKPRQAVGLDIGSNTISCALLAQLPSGDFEVTRDTSLPARLSQDLVQGGTLSRVAVYRSLEALETLAEQFEMANLPVRAVATQVLRMAGDPSTFLAPASSIIGTSIEVINGETEALLGCRGAIHGLPARGNWTVVDVGGQSTELTMQKTDGGWIPHSMAMGAVGLTTQFFKTDPPDQAQVEALRAHIQQHLDGLTSPRNSGTVVGVAGTASTLGVLESGCSGWCRDQVHGMKISRSRVEHWLSLMLTISSADRAMVHGLGAARADVFPAGLCVLLEVMLGLDCSEIVVSANGLRVGAALSLLED